MSGFFQRLSSFTSALFNYVISGGQLVDQNTANIRAATCAFCHNNKLSGKERKGCCGRKFIEDSIVLATRTKIIGDKKTASHAQLKTCAICGCDLRLKVWFPKEAINISEDEKNGYPTFCWIKNL